MAAENGFDLYNLAYLEYNEGMNYTLNDPHYKFDEVVSRSGYYVCFCQSMINVYERDPSHIYYLEYTQEDGTKG